MLCAKGCRLLSGGLAWAGIVLADSLVTALRAPDRDAQTPRPQSYGFPGPSLMVCASEPGNLHITGQCVWLAERRSPTSRPSPRVV